MLRQGAGRMLLVAARVPADLVPEAQAGHAH
jgi:hypothetical protein